MSNYSPAIGIDLGTTYCCVGYLTSDNHVDIMDNDHGERTTPSYVAFHDNKEVIGKPARETVFRSPENVIYDSKRLIGRKFSDVYLQQNLKQWSFNVAADENGLAVVQISQAGKATSFKPHEISAKLLAYMKNVAEKRLERAIQNAVITVPAHFNFHQRTATVEAGKLAGLNVLKIINEPTAAVLAYVHKHGISNCKNILVFDLGGGTLDVSVVTVQNGNISVQATTGNTHLGGRDFDNNLSTFIVEKIKNRYNIDVTNRKRTMQRIRGITESVKTKLSFQSVVYFDLPCFLDGEDVDIEISRDDFENINTDLFKSCIHTVKTCLDDAKIKKEEVQKILLIGGSTRIPKIQTLLREFFDVKKELTQAISPDEAVAYGAAVEAAMFDKGDKQEVASEITDVAPLSLGIKILGEMMYVLIPRNTPIPVTKTQNCATVSDKMTKQPIDIYEGERSLAKYNTKIGTCVSELPSKPPGYPLKVSFHVNTNGILEVGVVDDAGVYKKMTIEYEKHTVQKTSDIILDASQNKESDEARKNVINQWIKLRHYCTRMKALCTYKKSYIRSEDSDAIMTIAGKTLRWVDNHMVENGTAEEESAILNKQKEIEAVCEPVAEKYECLSKIRNMNVSDFYNFVSE